MKKIVLSLAVLALTSWGVQAATRWQMQADGSIQWTPKDDVPHDDHIEMSGKRVSVVLRYGVDQKGAFHINQSMVWPMLRTIPNNTHASLMRRFDWNALEDVQVNGRALGNERVKKITLDGTLRVESQMWASQWLTVKRQYFPSTEGPVLYERFTIVNTSDKAVGVELPVALKLYNTDARKGVYGAYGIQLRTSVDDKHYHCQLQPKDSVVFWASITAAKEGEKGAVTTDEAYAKELQARYDLVAALQKNLVLETPDDVINRMFAFAKVRASESIYETKQGPVHGPGGESYYAAIWANDQAEYVNPFFPFEGYAYGNAASLNSYEWFARYMNDEWKPIPSSIIAEGTDIWNGAGDRGDAAMIAHGAARYVLARGDKEEALRLWPLITWCLEYCNKQLTPEGVVASRSDELEGRFPSGKANLCTSSLYYDGLISAAYLCKELGEPARVAKRYLQQAADLRKAMDKYFARPMDGFDTYQYYEGNDKLRAWICIPLCMGITERAKGTIDALFSPQLWTKDGLLTQAGDKTFWDRSTLYALRGVYAAGYPDKADEYMHYYSETRLLGDHVPYAIEAWPEGSQRHLSAESGLYARIVTEGLFGIRPTGFRSFLLKPEMPTKWQTMALRHVRAFGGDFDIEVSRKGAKLNVAVKQSGKTKRYTAKQGQNIEVKL